MREFCHLMQAQSPRSGSLHCESLQKVKVNPPEISLQEDGLLGHVRPALVRDVIAGRDQPLHVPVKEEVSPFQFVKVLTVPEPIHSAKVIASLERLLSHTHT
jgi:hypothetical protein